MSTGYYVVVTIHVLAALLWLGGMFFLGVVGAPVLRRIEPPALRRRLFQELGVAHQGGAALLLVAVILAWHADGLAAEAADLASERTMPPHWRPIRAEAR